MKAEGCREWRERIGALVLGQLPEEERFATEAHLDGCPACRAEAEALAPVAALLGARRSRPARRPRRRPRRGSASGSSDGSRPSAAPRARRRIRLKLRLAAAAAVARPRSFSSSC